MGFPILVSSLQSLASLGSLRGPCKARARPLVGQEETPVPGLTGKRLGPGLKRRNEGRMQFSNRTRTAELARWSDLML